jgi:hypothetical protein
LPIACLISMVIGRCRRHVHKVPTQHEKKDERQVAFDEIKAEIGALLARVADQPHDRRELEIMLHEKLSELKAFGMPLPEDLVELDAALDQQLSAEARQRSRHPTRHHRD